MVEWSYARGKITIQLSGSSQLAMVKQAWQLELNFLVEP